MKNIKQLFGNVAFIEMLLSVFITAFFVVIPILAFLNYLLNK